MKFLKELQKNQYLTEEDNSALPEIEIKNLQKLIRKGAETSSEWSNALQLLHKAYEVANIERPTPAMISAWKQYETLITYTVQQLTKYNGLNGNWRMTSESFEIEKMTEFTANLFLKENVISHKIEGRDIDDVVEYIKTNLDMENVTYSQTIMSDRIKVNFFEYGVIKSNIYLEILKE